ncbi:intermembrane lipid transfer protein VPS13A-like isoform X1 [Oscarella lobularis]|uniref:intermembrane lipid transfer protein VPS13A-like isoform X1 n=1 Tax=Oscarella lobularis TaxID=121494 RepID=UPI003313D658
MFSAARDQLSHLREGGQASLQQALDQPSLFDVAIRGRSSCFILPESGRLTESSNIDLGQFSLKSQLQGDLPENASQQQLGDQAYDEFTLDVTEISAFVAPTRLVWEDSKHLPASPLYLIQPLGLELTLRKSIVPNDTRLPEVTLAAVLPAIEFSLSDKKIQTMIKIAESLPLPELARKPTKSTSNVLSRRGSVCGMEGEYMHITPDRPRID